MPNGHEEERKAVWNRSRLWGIVWDLADLAYYLGLVGSILLPLLRLFGWLKRFEPPEGWLLWRLAVSVGLLIVCFPVGIIIHLVGQAVAEWATGLRRKK